MNRKVPCVPKNIYVYKVQEQVISSAEKRNVDDDSSQLNPLYLSFLQRAPSVIRV